MTIRNLDHAVHPRSLAVFGASEREGSVGKAVMRNIVAGGFEGDIWPVNPKRGEACGRPCYPDAAAIPGVPDLGVIVTPAETVPGIIADLGAKLAARPDVPGLSIAVLRRGGNAVDAAIAAQAMLSLVEHSGCVGFRPDFSIVNTGWGEAKDMKMSIRFTRVDEDSYEPTGDPGPAYTADVGSFGEGIDVSVRDVLDQAGVDTAALEAGRFSCPSRDALNVCRGQVMTKVNFGAAADYVGGENETIGLTGIGTLDYSWSDDDGNTYRQNEPFRVFLTLAYIQTPQEAAECGDGFGGSPEATRYQDVEFPIGKRDYAIAMPVRGNRNLDSYTARLKMWSSMSSIHRFAIAAHFADGSTRESKPVTFFFFRPRQSLFESKSEPASCYLPRTVEGCG